MQLIKFAVIGLILLAITCRSGSCIKIEFSKESPDDLRLVDAVEHILTSCYGDRIRAVGLAGNLPDTLGRRLSTKHLIPVALIDNKLSDRRSSRYKPLQFKHDLPIFVVEAFSFERFIDTILVNMIPTIWWNHMATFIIVDRSRGCDNYLDYLRISWHFSMLNAKLICNSRDGVIWISTYNPFTKHAPAPWDHTFTYAERNGHPFATFGRPYEKNEATCVNLDFDKTQNLGGYPITVGKYALSETENDRGTNIDRYWRTRNTVLQSLFRSLNVIPKFETFTTLSKPITSDMRKTGRLMLYVWNEVKITYPFTQTGFILISQFRGHKTQLEKILYVIDYDSRLGMGVVYFITLIFLKFFVRQAIVPALLNLVRITCNTGFATLSNTNAVRIFLTGLLFFVVTMQGIYQGNLASLLTTHIPRRNVDSMQDLVDLDYKLYFNDYMEPFVKQYPQLDGRYTTLDFHQVADCLDHAINDSSAACLWLAQSSVLDRLQNTELHTSSEFVTTLYTGFEIRWDWPLEDKVNVILSRMVEGDVILPWDIKCKPLDLNEFKYDKKVKNNKDFKKIELHEVAFAFVILGIGLVCATIVLIIEVAISRI